MESCGMSLIKYLLFIFNVIFAISGIGIIVAGAVVLYDIGGFSHFLENRILAPPVVLIVAGSIVFFVAFLGCCGAIKENYHMLMAFAGLLVIIFVIEMAVGIAASAFKSDFSDALKETLKNSMGNYTKDEGEKMAWDNVQRDLQCCGVDSPADWNGKVDDQLGPGYLPPSCCVQNRNLQTADGKPERQMEQCVRSDDDEKVYQKGCYDILKEIVRKSAIVLMGVGLGIAFIEIAGIVLACCLASAIKKQDEESK